jgi:hypothetical protein
MNDGIRVGEAARIELFLIGIPKEGGTERRITDRRPAQTVDSMTGSRQAGGDFSAKEAGGTGDKNAHR